MNIYIANGFSGKRRAQKFAEASGCKVLSTWHRDDDTHEPGEMRACRDYYQIMLADVVVCMDNDSVGGGRHTELGLALAWNKIILCVGWTQNVFEHLGNVQHYGSDELCLREISRLKSLRCTPG
jgi:hypothetical protein